jgi:predicted ATPase
LRTSLDRLVRSELASVRGTPPTAVYTFKHALIQNAAYETLLRRRRAELHNKIVAALEQDFPETVAADPALLAHHCEAAGLPGQAMRYRSAAAQAAFRASALIEAIAHADRGLEIADS